MKTDTAHRAWNRRWSTEEGRAEWLVPDPAVANLAELLAGNHQAAALDLGCGVGRHALLFARLGFRTAAVDLAEAGLTELRRVAEQEGLSIETHVSPMNELPFADGSFDYVLAFNVIYHGDPAIVRATVDEIRRVLKPGGLFQGTMLSKRNAGYGVGTEVAPDTFVREMSGTDAEEDSDKVHPHFYTDAAGLVSLLSGFELLYLRDGAEKRPGSWHWQFAAEKRA
ncbi:class I SAM-dependent methyltransferase [Pseudochelatococcus sp. B33]